MKIGVLNLLASALYDPDHTSIYGGAEVETYQLTKLFRDLGHDVHVVLSRTPEAGPNPVDGIHIIGLNENWSRPGRRRQALWRILSTLKPDLWFAKNITEHTAILGLWCRLHGRAFVYRAANQRDIELTKPSHRHGWKQSLYYRLTIPNATRIVAQTTDQERAYRARFPAGRVFRIPNFIDAEGQSVLQFPERSGILWVGHLTPVKGPERVIELAARLPHLPFTLIASTPESMHAQELRERIRQGSNITLIEDVPYARMQGHFDRARVLLNTSLSEGFPNTFLQAMKAGTPLATTGLDPGGLIMAGLGHAEGDLTCLATWLDDVHGSPSTWQGYHETVVRHFNRHYARKVFESFYQTVLEG